MFVLAVPGLGPLVKRELDAIDGVTVTGLGNDGRADVVLCDVVAGREQALLGLRTVEDAFVEVGRTLRAEGDRPAWIARRILRPARLASSVRMWQRQSGSAPARSGRQRRGHRSGPTSYRVVARVLQERTWQRTELRRAFGDAIAKAEPSWKPADPADLELWTLEYARGRFVAGVRLTTARMRQHGGRTAERPGALRPTVAAAMVMLAGPPDRAGTALLDPCCGSGTILAEAKTVGWSVEGRDIDPDAVSASRRNVGGAVVAEGDARAVDLPDASVAACVSNLPFGRRYDVQGDPAEWLTAVLAELVRVTRPSGRIVLLAPDVPRSVVPTSLRRRDRHTMRLLGMSTTIWSFERR
jgi:Putative RNA methylase family UPF0020